MLLRALNIFFQKNILLYCFVGTSLYLLSTYIIFKDSPSLKTINLTAVDALLTNKNHGLFKTTTTTTPTPLNLLLELARNKNITKVKKYDAMQAYTFLMKRRIDRLTGKYTKSVDLMQLVAQEHRINNSVHIFYTEVLPTVVKDKTHFLLNYGKNATIHLVEENLKLANKTGAGVILLRCSRLSNSLISQTSGFHQTLKTLFHLAPMYGIQISVAIKDYMKRNAMSVKKDVKIFISQYGKEPALYRYNKTGNYLPVIYILSSYLILSNEWAEVMRINGKHSIRDTKTDAIFLGELKDEEHMSHIRKSYFDGFFMSHLLNKASYGSTWKNWQSIAKWADEKDYIWSAGILEASAGTAAVGVALRTVLRCLPRPHFISLMNVPNSNEYFHLSQDYLRMLFNSSVFHV